MNISQLLTKLKTLVYSKSETDSLLGGKASSSHTHTKSQITDFPTIPSKVSQLTNDSGFITGVSWDSVSNKPSTFTPSSHTHTKSQITDFPTIPTNTNQLTNGAGFITSSGSCNYANSAGSAGSASSATTAGAVRTGVDNGSSKDLVYATMANNDYCRISCGGSDDAGYLEIATGDGASEPIYVRQYPWESNASPRTLTLLDGSGNTQFPGTVTAPTFSGNVTGNCSGSAGSVAWNNVSGRPTIPTNTNQLTNGAGFLSADTGIKVTKGASISTSGSGYWAAMCNTEQGSPTPTLPTTNQWWHVLSMDWSGSTDDVTNWCSQLALPTQQNSCLYWRRNDGSNTSINSSTWHKVIDDTNIGSQSVNYANSSGWANHAGQADYLGDIGSTDRNGASGTGWYSVGFSYSYDEGHGELAINNYWGIRLNCRDSNHVTINGNRIIDSGNTGNISISGYQVYVG